MAEIRKITLAKVICENCDVVDKIQKSVFDQYHEFLNERVPCRSLPAVNLNLWKDEVSYHSFKGSKSQHNQSNCRRTSARWTASTSPWELAGESHLALHARALARM